MLAGNTWMWYNVVMESSLTTTETLMSDPFNDPLTHSGNEMLSGMSTKPSAVTDEEMKKFLKDGGEIKVIKPRKVRKHSLRSKSHQKGGRWSSYNVGGNAKIAAMRKAS